MFELQVGKQNTACLYMQQILIVLLFCCRYIRHLNKVIPKVIELKGEPTGY